MVRKRIKTQIRMDEIRTDRTKKHYKSVTLTCKPKYAWKALANGSFEVLDVDLETLRAQRKRKGGN